MEPVCQQTGLIIVWGGTSETNNKQAAIGSELKMNISNP